MDAILHRQLRQQVHRAAREVTLALNAGDLATCQAALARAELDLQLVTAELQVAMPEASLSMAPLDDIDLKGRALRLRAESLAAELFARRPSTMRRTAARRIMLYLLAAASLLVGSMVVGEFRRWNSPEGLLVTYYQDADLTRPVWHSYALDLLAEPNERPLPRRFGKGDFSSRWTGWLQVPQTADYTLRCQSEDGLRLYLDDRCVLDNWRDQPWTNSLRTVQLPLTAGLHPLKVEHYARHTRTAALCIQWGGGGIPTNTLLAAPYLRKHP